MHHSSTRNKGYIAARRGSSPISRIPVEILGTIFIHSRDVELGSPQLKDNKISIPNPLNPLSPRAVPWILSNVSRHWKQVAEDTPELWRIAMVEKSENVDHNLRSADETVKSNTICVLRDRLETWMRNGRCHRILTDSHSRGVLYISYHNRDSSVDEWDATTLKTLFEYAEAAHTLDITAPMDLIRHLPLLNGHLSRLESLRVEVLDMPITTRLGLHIFSNIPRLRCFEIAGVPSWWQTIPIPWAQVRRCNIHEYLITDSFNILAAIADLGVQSVRIHTASITQNRRNEVLQALELFSPIVLSSLHSIEYISGPDYHRTVLTKLVVPNLKSLVLRDHHHAACHDAAGMIARSGAKIEHLAMHHPYRNNLECVLKLLSCTMHTIRSLIVNIDSNYTCRKDFSDSMVRFIIEKIENRLGFPCLESVRINATCWSNPESNRYSSDMLAKLLEVTRSDTRSRKRLHVEIQVLGVVSEEFGRLSKVLLSSSRLKTEKWSKTRMMKIFESWD